MFIVIARKPLCFFSFRVFFPTPTETEEASEGETHEGEEEGDKEGEGEESPQAQSNGEPGMWEETFKTHHDSKPYGKEHCLFVRV